jgi:hypothetical protein
MTTRPDRGRRPPMIEQIGPCWVDSLTAQPRAERHATLRESARLTLQLLTTVVVILFFRNGYIPELLNRLGDWSWMGAGAAEMAVMWSMFKTIQCLRESTRRPPAAGHTQPSGEHPDLAMAPPDPPAELSAYAAPGRPCRPAASRRRSRCSRTTGDGWS